MKNILISTLILFFVSTSFAETKTAHKKSAKLSSSKKKNKKRKIASVVEKPSISELESRSKKTKAEYIQLGDHYQKLKNYKKALENFKLANKPQSNEALDRLAHLYELMGDDQEELRALELIRVDGKASPNQLTRLGMAYAKIKKTEEALISFRESIAKAPKYEKAYQGIYGIYKDLKNFYDARLIIIEVLEKFGEQKFWLNEFCKIEVEQNYHDNAKQICQKAIAKDPKNPENHVYLALAFKSTENEDQARKILFNAAKQFKKSEVAQWNAGQMSCAIKNWEQGSDQFKQCIKVDPQSGRCHLNLGKTYFELKKYDDALDSLMKACLYIKGIDVEIRRFSYELDKINQSKMAKKYLSSTDKCSNDWFTFVKKNKNVQVYSRNTDRCFNP